MAARPRLGRPRELPDRVRVSVYLTAREQRTLARVAQRAQLTTSAWLRRLVREALRRSA
jgi:hypothetical protein